MAIETPRLREAIKAADACELESLICRRVSDWDIRDFVERKQLFSTRDYLVNCDREHLEAIAFEFLPEEKIEEWAVENDIRLPSLCGGAKTASKERELYEAALRQEIAS